MGERALTIIVQKYGGTSVGTVERMEKLAARVAEQVRGGTPQIAVVVSAMMGETDRLVGLMQKVNSKASARAYDMTVSAGEQISVGLVAAALEKQGVPSEPILGHQLGILTDDSHSRARIRSIRTDRIHEAWANGRIPVIAGFQGVTDQSEITTLGRGGSDTSAVALAVALKASYCEINTDVYGIYTADPRVVPEARLLETLDYDTALELASSGSKVLHTRCVELAAKYQMPVVVRSSFDTDPMRRTQIMTFQSSTDLEAPVVSGVTLDEDVVLFSVSGLIPGSEALSGLFQKIAQYGVNIDVIVQEWDVALKKMSVSFTTTGKDLERATNAIEEVRKESEPSLTFKTTRDLAKVSTVGLGMRSHPGVAAKVFATLATHEIEIRVVSTSEIKISCVIPRAEGRRATQVLHQAFFSGDENVSNA